MFHKIILFFLHKRIITLLLLLGFILLGTVYAPFNWDINFLPRNTIPVDAIPDIGDNQQIVATKWHGRSPKDIEDQITYPLTASLLGIPGVKTIRSSSMFGMSFIYIIFEDNIEFYWSRSRILEKLNSLPPNALPSDAHPTLGPDATALGQIFWYTLEGRNPQTGEPTGGWDPQELRTIQDYYIKYALSSAKGVSEVASIGGFVKEYQIDVDPNAMKAFRVNIMDIMKAVKKSNIDIGAETIELNKVEYVIRSLGYVKNLSELEETVITVRKNIPVRIKDVAKVHFGPTTRRAGLDKEGVEAVGAAVIARYASNPLEVINNVKAKISEIEFGLPSKTLPDGTISKVSIIPFYDRTQLIKETIGTLESALSHEILISIIVIIVLVLNLRASILISTLLPVAILMTFIAMKWAGVDANIVALSGIAIAIGVMVDVGIVFVENIIRHIEISKHKKAQGKTLLNIIYKATTEVSSAITTALATTIISFLPIFVMEAAEGKLFKPLAFTKTFALLASFILGIVVLPTLAYLFFSIRLDRKKINIFFNSILILLGLFFVLVWGQIPALALIFIGVNHLFIKRWYNPKKSITNGINIGITLLVALWYLSIEWLPLGASNAQFLNFVFVCCIVGVILGSLMLVVHYYVPILKWALKNKWKFMTLPLVTIFFGILAWLGGSKVFGFLPESIYRISPIQSITHFFPGLGQEFMPSLDEGSFLLMPTSMPHSGIEKNKEYVKLLDRRLSAIPEVELAVGKWGRINSALDPAPIQMFENTINYVPEYILDEDGHPLTFKINKDGSFILKDGSTYHPQKDSFRLIKQEALIQDDRGNYFRQWRPHIKSPNDIWEEIVKVTHIPGLTSAPKLQPIETRLIMLSTGMRAPMGVKVFGPNLESIEKAGFQLEHLLKQIPSIQSSSVFYDRTVGSPYLEIQLDRQAIARYGMTIESVQEIIQVAIGGKVLTNTVEGRERFPIRVRYARELRNTPEEIENILIPSTSGIQIPLNELADIHYVRGPQMIKSENTFLTSYIIFDKIPNKAEVDVVEEAQAFLETKIKEGSLILPRDVSYSFSGNYEQQIRAMKKIAIAIPISLLLVFLLLYFQFKTFIASSIHFSGVFVAFAGGFIMLWLYSQPWFLNFSIFGLTEMQDLFQIHPINLSIAVWIGFIALFGIATDDGVIMGTYIHQVFEKMNPKTVKEVREAVIIAGSKRVRPAMMTAAVAIIALLPVLTSKGKGADIMIPMAIPTFGGMVIQIMTMFVVPILQCIWRENAVKKIR